MTNLEEYREKCLNGEITVGNEMKIGLNKYYKDLSDPRYCYDTSDFELRREFMETFIKLTKSPFYGKPLVLMLWQKAFIETLYSFKRADTGKRRFKKALLLIGRKNTKALDLETLVPTPDGYKKIRDVHINDYVFSEKGIPIKVLGESEIFKNRVCYEITFEDGEKIIADENHRWTVRTRRSASLKNYQPKTNRKRHAYRNIDQYGYETLTTKDMVSDFVNRREIGNEYKYKVPITRPIQYEEKKLLLSPYILGVWLGDGLSGGNAISCGKQDIEEMLQLIKEQNIYIRSTYKDEHSNYTIRIGKSTGRVHKNDVLEALRYYDLLHNKHIPEDYLMSSIEQRMELLKGLMDTDGTCTKTGQCGFTQKNKVLAYDFSKLLSSLGIKHNIKEENAKCNGKDCEIVYKITFYVDKQNTCFKLKRKTERLKEKLSTKVNHKSIIDIRRVDNRDTKCITVDNERGLFLCGLKNTVTHNSETCNALGDTELIVGNEGADIVCSSNDDTQANILFDGMDTMRRMFDPNSDITHKNLSFIKNKLTDSKIFKLTDKTRNKEGRNIDFAIVDEVHEMKDNIIVKSIETSQSTKDEPLLILITTEGFVHDGYLDKELKYARQVLNGEIEDDSYLIWLYTQDSEQEIWQDEKSWYKSNPTLGVVKKWDYLREQLNKARYSTEDRAFVLAKDFNIKQNATQMWLMDSDYTYIQEEKQLEEFRNCYCFAAVDLSQTTDLSNAKLLFMKPGDNNKYIFSKYFIPESKLQDSSDKEAGAKYEEWARQGVCDIHDGNAVDLAKIAEWFKYLYTEYGIIVYKLGYDQRFAKDFLDTMKSYGYGYNKGETCEMIYQSKFVMSTPMKMVEADLKSKLIHGLNDMDKWCLSNTSFEIDGQQNIMPIKVTASKRIDGAVTLIILYAIFMRYRNEYIKNLK